MRIWPVYLTLLALAVSPTLSGEGISPRPVIYQLLPRLFGNTNETRRTNGTLVENGCGKFAHINSAALSSLRELGITHLWITGVLEQASGTSYPNRPADDPDILKGIAGSPYAIRDYFDVSPDYALVPENRLDEFRELLGRCKRLGFKVLIDFVPNHVARSYASDVRPDLSFGEHDDRSVFFKRDNHFFYLDRSAPGDGPPLILPTSGKPGCDGRFPLELEYGRVTGNNVVSWKPALGDWYETVKLNYGHDFTKGRNTSHLPGPDADLKDVPKTWQTMDEILAYWQAMGIDGFRVDVAHMVPMEFWKWVVKRCRARNEKVFFTAEAYDDDPMKLVEHHVLDALLDAGFNSVYDDPSYDLLEGIYESGKWANDLDPLTFTGERFHNSLRYAENHDEIRLANPKRWGGLGMCVGKPVSAVLFSMGRGPVMLYHGQEVGEPAVGAEGFGADDARTSIFDYGSMPEFVKWVNGGKFDGGLLSAEQIALRQWYSRLVDAIREPAFTRGSFYGLNHFNRDNPQFGRVGSESVSGHWLYAFLRHDAGSGQSFMIVANFHGTETLLGTRIRIPKDAQRFLGREAKNSWSWVERLEGKLKGSMNAQLLDTDGISVGDIPPVSAYILEIGH